MPRRTLRGSWCSAAGRTISTISPRPFRRIPRFLESGYYTGLANGADYMALAHRETIDPSKGSKHYIPGGVLLPHLPHGLVHRRADPSACGRGREDAGGHGRRFAAVGPAASGRYEIGDYPYRLITEGRGGMVEFAASGFRGRGGHDGHGVDARCGRRSRRAAGICRRAASQGDANERGQGDEARRLACGAQLRAGLPLCRGAGRWSHRRQPPNWTSRSFRGTNTTGATAVSAGEDISRSTRAAARCSNPNWSSRVHGSGLSTTAGAGRQLASAHGERVVLLLVRRIQRARTRPVYGGELLVVDDQCVECGSGMDVRFRLRHSE